MLSDTDLATALDSLPGERITAGYMESRIKEVQYFRPYLMTLCTLVLDNGFMVTGEAACVDPTNYNAEVGNKLAYDNAFRKLWPFFGFLLAETRHQNSKPGTNPGARAAEDWYKASISPRERGDHTHGLSFGGALAWLKDGAKVMRAGWNGKGMWLALSGDGVREVPDIAFWCPANAAYATAQGGTAKVLPCITMKTATGEILMGWLASQTDMLADDWMVVG